MRTVVELVLTIVLNAAWQVTLVTAMALMADRLLSNTHPRFRHLLWVLTLLVSFALPVATSGWQLFPTISTSQEVAPVVSSGPDVGALAVRVEEIQPEKSVSSALKTAESTAVTALPIRLNRMLAVLVTMLYGGLLVYGAARLSRAWWRTRKIVATAFHCQLPERINRIVELCNRILRPGSVRLFCSDSIALPITVGGLRPRIILPESLTAETDEQVLISALGHELVHVKRRDYLMNLFYEVIYVVFWFHPAAALTMRRIRQTREICCDRIVADKLLEPEIYARSVMRLIAAAPPHNRLAVTTIGITDTDNLEKRIMSLLRKHSISAPRKALVLAAALLLVIAPCVIGARLALAFDIGGAPFESLSIAQSEDNDSPRQADQARDQIKSLERALQKQVQQAPEPQRHDLAKRLLEVQLNLLAHDQSITRYQQPQPRAAEEELRRAREILAKIESTYPSDQQLVREAKERVIVAEKIYAQSRELDNQNRSARLITRVSPEYTADARARGIAGTVVLAVTIGSDGSVQAVDIKKSLFPSLDAAAAEAAKQMRFEPALRNGTPVAQNIDVEFYFSATAKNAEVEQIHGTDLTADVREMRKRKEQEVAAQEARASRQAELAEAAVISMDRAVQIATSRYPGKVLACSLGRDKEGPVFYHLVIVSSEGNKHRVRYVWLSAIDGTILKSEERARAIQAGVLNSKAVSLPVPTYPAIARAAHADGDVRVRVTIDEGGNVIEAQAIGGHPLLQSAAVSAARAAKFTPTRLDGEPVRVSGLLVYNFVAQ